VAAGAIIGGQVYCCDHPANIGGGTSQFATTLYNAVFFGAYEDVDHTPHSLYFTRYPVVREATLGWAGPDVVFRNDTVYPVTIRTSHTATSVTVQLIGNNEGRSVITWLAGDPVTPSEGGRATVYRGITYANGSTTTESWTHTYRVPVDEDEEPPPPPPKPPPPPPPGIS
jgi:vancomycin resistance protein YoaR